MPRNVLLHKNHSNIGLNILRTQGPHDFPLPPLRALPPKIASKETSKGLGNP